MATKAAGWRGSHAASTNAKSAPIAKPKSVSSETTFDRDISDYRALERILWAQTEEVSARLKEKALAGATVTLKLKTADFKIRTRAHSFDSSTQLAAKIFAAARPLLKRESDGTKYRLLGVGVSALTSADQADPADFVDGRAAEAEHAVDRVRARFGEDAVVRGLAFEPPEKRQLSGRPPVAVKAERHAMRQFGDRYRPLVQRRRIENREIAPLIRSPIDRGEQIAVALWEPSPARNKDRLRHEIALGQLIAPSACRS